MQTSQVSNPANVLATPAPAGKQSDANSAPEPFGKVLSREVADRRANAEPAKTREPGNDNAAARRTERNGSKVSEAKSTTEPKSTSRTAEKEDTEATGEAMDAAAQASEDMLALVATLNQIAPTAEAATALPDSAAAATAGDPTLELATGMNPTVAEQIATPIVPQTVDSSRVSTSRKLDADLAGHTGKTIAQPALTGKSKAELQTAETASGAAAKAPELLDGSSGAKASSKDFATAVTESLSAVAGTATPVQQAALHAAQAMGNTAADKLTPRVGTPAWDQALGQKVVWMVAGEQQSASLTLNPPDLGPLQVVLNVSNAQATATFIAAQPEVRQALEAAMPKLREMLGEAGIQLGQSSVNSGAPNQQGGFDQQGSPSARHAHRADQVDNRGDAQVRVSRVQPASSGQGLVDTFA